MKAMRAWTLVATLATLAWAVPTRGTTDQSADEVVRAATEALFGALANADAAEGSDADRAVRLIREILLPHVDMNRITRWVLGRYWRSATPEQRQRFAVQFEALLLHSYGAALRNYRSDRIVYAPTRSRTRSDRETVSLQVKQEEGPPIELTFEMALLEGRWRVYDVKLGGISLVSNYRNTFASIMRHGGIEELIEHLAQHNRRTGATS